MLRTLQKAFDQHFHPGTTFIVGVSGGVDSMTLMYCLSELKEYRFIIITIDHSIRKSSSDDAKFVQQEAKKLGLECFVKKIKVPTLAKQQRKGIEEAARDLRYEIFKKYQKKYRAKAIITAHHHDDQLESILLHLLRGSDLHGLVGMKVFSEQQIFRPFLSLSKKAIIAFAKKQKIPWREDHTNQNIDLTRNLIRHHLVKEFPQDLLIKVSQQARKSITILDLWVKGWSKEHITVHKNRLSFTRDQFIQLPLYLQFYLLHHLVKQYLHINHLSFSWLSSIYQWLISSRSDSHYKYQQKTLLFHQKSRIFLSI